MTGAEIYQRFVRELEFANKKISDFCKATNNNQGAISNWAKRGTMPSADLIIAIADYLDVSTDYVLGRTNIRNNDSSKKLLLPEEEILLNGYKGASESTKKMILYMLNFNNEQTD